MYIDDLVELTINLPDTDNIVRAERAPLLAIHACCCPTNESDPIPCHPMVSSKKLRAEAALLELKTNLGWTWDFCRLIISLPYNKFIAWSKKISDTNSSGVVIGKEFESTIGRLNYLALVVPFVNHFLSRLRELLQKAKKSPRQRARIPPNASTIFI